MCERESRMYDDESAWHNKFYNEVTSKVDEDIFKPLYTTEREDNRVGRPNASIRILVSMMILKEGCGCSDEQLYEQCRFNLLYRRALGMVTLDEQCPAIDSYYGFRRKICEYEEKNGMNLFDISLVNEISSLNRMDEVLHSLNRKLTDIAAIVHDIEQEVALQLEEKHITITNTLDTTLPIMGDPSMLYSIFRNLIDNSIAYSGEGTAIVIRCREERDMYHFRISDNGVGIPAEHIPHIFERFYRVDKGRNRKDGGTGLGLAIVKNAVMLHGGTISAAPVAGGGVEFSFTLKKNN